MKAKSMLGVTCLGLLISAYPSFATSGSPGPVQHEASSGQVLASRHGQPWTRLDPQSLDSGDTVRTGADGQLILGFPNGSRVRLSPGSELELVNAGADRADLRLHRGKLYGQASGGLQVETSRSRARASQGEFFLETQTAGARLHRLAGNATLSSKGADTPRYPLLTHLPTGVQPQKLLGRSASEEQLVGDFQEPEGYDLVAERPLKGKDAGPRKATSTEKVGGVRELAPDLDIVPPAPPAPAPVVEAPPPAVVSPPPTAAVAPAAVVSGGTSPFLFGGLGGLALIGILTGVSPGGDSDNEIDIPPGQSPPVPSPSLP